MSRTPGTRRASPPPYPGWGWAARRPLIQSPFPLGEGTWGATDNTPFGGDPSPGLVDYVPDLGQGGFDRAHAATPHLRAASGTLHNPVRFRRVAVTEVLAQSRFAMPLGQEAAEGWTL